MYEFLQEAVENTMTRNARSVSPETTVGDLYRLFATDGFNAYPVTRGDTLVGMVSKLDAPKVFGLSEDHILPRHKGGAPQAGGCCQVRPDGAGRKGSRHPHRRAGGL